MNVSNRHTKIEILKTCEEQLSREDWGIDSNEVTAIIKKIESLRNRLQLWAGFDPISEEEAVDHAAKRKRDYEQSKAEKEAEDVAKRSRKESLTNRWGVPGRYRR